MNGREMLQSAEFHQLVRRKWRVSLLLTASLFAVYYGYILLIAWDKPLLSRPLFEGGATTIGIVLGVGVILSAWVLTAIYVLWANHSHDGEVTRLRDQLTRGDSSHVDVT